MILHRFSLAVFMIGFSLLGFTKASAAQEWGEERLSTYLEQANRPACIFINSLICKQLENSLLIYNQIGNEEPRAGLNQRPILETADPIGPFMRKNQFVLLVDREQPLTMTLDLEKIIKVEQDSAKPNSQRQAIEQLIVKLKPAEKDELIIRPEGKAFKLNLASIRFLEKIVFEVREPNERYLIVLVILNKEKPVTLVDSAAEERLEKKGQGE